MRGYFVRNVNGSANNIGLIKEYISTHSLKTNPIQREQSHGQKLVINEYKCNIY